MKLYATEQRQQLLAFLMEHRDKQFSVEKIAAELARHTDISLSSVYRNIKKMVSDGDIVRRAVDGSRKFSYQYVGDVACRDHLHLKCDHCGMLVHMDSRFTEEILNSAALNALFHIDRKKTLLYGSCEECSKHDEEKADSDV